MAHPHANAVKSDWIEGRALQKSIQKTSRNWRKNGKTPKTKKKKREGFGAIFGGFGGQFGSQNTFKNPRKFWMRFSRRKKDAPGFSRVGLAECTGSLGRIMEGYENHFRQRIEPQTQRQGNGTLGLVSSTPSSVGRRSAHSARLGSFLGTFAAFAGPFGGFLRSLRIY